MITIHLANPPNRHNMYLLLVCGCAGLVDDDPAEEDDDFEVDLEAVDVVSFALAVVSLGFNALASDSMSFGNSCAMGWGNVV